MSKKLKPVPFFETEAEERHFWETHDSVDYVDWSRARRVQFPNLKLTPPEELAQAAESETAAD
ncbi:MAG: CopG family antitoxin [Chloroflexota bacterium]|nr:CopG family antitoxin [Chloroflexota bacterium]MDE2960595.1 CopG family antitoxin [Chloroflexota bacterium]